MNNLQKLTELQNKIGYVAGEVHPVAMLGLLGECGEVAGAANYMTPKAKSLTQDGFFDFTKTCQQFVDVAADIDAFKKRLRGSQPGEIHFAVKPDEYEFNGELADLFYYLNAVAIGRGLTIEDLAKISYDKVMAKRGIVREGDPAR
ncbi:NTP pyrophosphatase (non-canonical NTP hydrolase) [Spirosoma lacussanchae]|uniref:hypothetical protein n=1 Tax=Spirosoma lacussanchae TaxID=1884249 RepID=UPI001107FE39|nr:hypothetical protein [Spirosoma lacussanchae]